VNNTIGVILAYQQRVITTASKFADKYNAFTGGSSFVKRGLRIGVSGENHCGKNNHGA
jgi:hypothetical protein